MKKGWVYRAPRPTSPWNELVLMHSAFWLLVGKTATHKQLPTFVITKSIKAMQVRSGQREEASPKPSWSRRFSLNSISNSHQNMESIQGQEIMPMIVAASRELSERLTFCSGEHISLWGSSTHQLINSYTSIWHHLDYILHRGQIICAV